MIVFLRIFNKLRIYIHLQAILNRRQKFAMITQVKKHLPAWMLTDAHRFERDLMNLAFLPPDYINEAFENLHAEIRGKNDLYAIMGPLFAYYETTWLADKGPRLFSTYEEKERTNNHIERYHRSLKAMMFSNPEFHTFMSCLRGLQEKLHRDVFLVEHGSRVTRQHNAKYRKREAAIEKAWLAFGDLSTLSSHEMRKSRIAAFLAEISPHAMLFTGE